jgi:hypothetical protein
MANEIPTENTYASEINAEDGIVSSTRRNILEIIGILPVSKKPANGEVKSYNIMFVRNGQYNR